MNTGNLKQISAFENLVGFCESHGELYSPSDPQLKMGALSILLGKVKESADTMRTLQKEYNTALTTRRQAFHGLPGLMTRVVGTLGATTGSLDAVAEGLAIKKKFQSKRKKEQATSSPTEFTPEGVVVEPPPTRRNSQLDFDSKMANFASFLKVVKAAPDYRPHKIDLKVQSLETLLTSLEDMNKKVLDLKIALSNARATRDRLLYGKLGVHGIAKAVKSYIKGFYGYSSIEHKQVRSIKFTSKKVENEATSPDSVEQG